MRRIAVLVIALSLSAAMCSTPFLLVLHAETPAATATEHTSEKESETAPVHIADPRIDHAASTFRDFSTLITVLVTGLSAICAGLLVAWRKLREAWAEHEENTRRATEKIASQAVKAADKVAATTRDQMAEVREVVQDTSPTVLAIVSAQTEQLRQQIARIEAGDMDAEKSRKKMIDAIWDLSKRVDSVSDALLKVLADSAIRKDKGNSAATYPTRE